MTTRKRILCISRAYGEHAGGMERLSFELISELKKESTFDVAEIVHETKLGISLFSARLRSLVFVLTVLPRAVQESKNVDVVHIGDPVLSFVGWWIMRFRKIPVAVTVHGLDVAYANTFYQMYLNLFFDQFSAYIPISEYARGLLKQRTVSGVIAVIPPGIRDHLYDSTKTREDLEKLLKRDISKTIVFATTGRLILRKGHAWFIENVMPHLPQNGIYAVAGSGPESENLSLLVKSLKLEDRVLLLGRISNEDQKTLLNTIDAFIQPNILTPHDGEGFGIAPLEASLCGRMVFASDVDGIPSAIHNGKNGVLLAQQDADAWIQALTTFFADKKIVQPEDARTYTLETFSWKTITKRYGEVFTTLTR